MQTTLIFLGAAVALGGVFVCWRLLSQKHTVPCPAWLSWLVELDNPLFRSNKASIILSHLELRPGMQVLDAGCGPGRLTIPMAKIVGPSGHVVALDLQEGMLRRVEFKAAQHKLTIIEYCHAKLGTGELTTGPFDRAALAAVLGEIPNQRAALQEIFDSLKPGGVLAVSETIADPHFQSRSNVLSLAAPLGFREKSHIGGRFAYTLYLEKPEGK